jgi:hypothetical protein
VETLLKQGVKDCIPQELDLLLLLARIEPQIQICWYKALLQEETKNVSGHVPL